MLDRLYIFIMWPLSTFKSCVSCKISIILPYLGGVCYGHQYVALQIV